MKLYCYEKIKWNISREKESIYIYMYVYIILYVLKVFHFVSFKIKVNEMVVSYTIILSKSYTLQIINTCGQRLQKTGKPIGYFFSICTLFSGLTYSNSITPNSKVLIEINSKINLSVNNYEDELRI